MKPAFRLFLVTLMSISLIACYPTKQSDNVPLPKGIFEVNEGGNFYGTFFVRGYPRIVSVPEAFCFENCPEFDYVFFHILESGNQAFLDHINEDLRGNSFVQQDAIGLGCVKDGSISYWNSSDTLGERELTLSDELSQSLLAATIDEPISLNLIKLELSYGKGAPTCTSHITRIEKIQE